MLKHKLQEDLKDAMRQKDQTRLRTLRSLRAALQHEEIAARGGNEEAQGLSRDQEVEVLQKQAKQRRDAIEQYEAADRDDLASKERDELAIIKEYLPAQLDDDAIRAELHEIVKHTGATGMKDMGRVMGEAMSRLKGRADGRRVQAVAQELLSA